MGNLIKNCKSISVISGKAQGIVSGWIIWVSILIKEEKSIFTLSSLHNSWTP